MKTKTILILLASLWSAQTIAARELSLKEALTLAREHSFELKKADAQTLAYEQNLKTAIAERYPILSATGVASYKDVVPQLEIAIPGLPVMTRNIGLHENYQADFRLNMPLYTGGKISGGVDMARANVDYYEALKQASLDDITYWTRVSYLTLHKNGRLAQSAQAALDRAEITDRDVQSAFSAGTADSVDILEAHLAVTNARFQLASAINNRRQTELTLLMLLGLEPSESLTLTDSPQKPSGESLNFTGLAEDKPQLLAATAAVAMNRSLVKLNQADLFPTLSAFGGYSYGKPNIDQFHDAFNHYFTVGAQLSWAFNLGGKASSKVSLARHQLAASQHEHDKIAEKLTNEARLALENLKLSYQRYETAQESYRTALDNHRLASEKHRQGVLSANRLLEIQALLDQAEASLAAAEVDYYIVQSHYYYTIGSKKLEEGI